MTPSQAAAVIGCSTRHVRTQIQRGKIRAKLVSVNVGQGGPIMQAWNIAPAEARRYRDKPQTRGWPRGQKRSSDRD